MDAIIERPAPRISLGAIFAGVVTSLALEVVLLVLGAAVGLSAFHGASAKGGVIWLLATLCASLFAGGLVASLAVRSSWRRDGVLNAFVTWGVTALLGVFGVGSALAGASQSTSSMSGSITQGSAALGMWGLFVALVLPACFAILGGILGASTERRVVRRTPTTRPIYPTTSTQIPQPS